MWERGKRSRNSRNFRPENSVRPLSYLVQASCSTASSARGSGSGSGYSSCAGDTAAVRPLRLRLSPSPSLQQSLAQPACLLDAPGLSGDSPQEPFSFCSAWARFWLCLEAAENTLPRVVLWGLSRPPSPGPRGGAG